MIEVASSQYWDVTPHKRNFAYWNGIYINDLAILSIFHYLYLNPRAACNWVYSFMSDKQTTLAFNGQECQVFQAKTGIPQGSHLSPIFFLFYNAELLEKCADPRLRHIVRLGCSDRIQVHKLQMPNTGMISKFNCGYPLDIQRKYPH